MATEKNFRVKKGLDVKSGAVTVENAPSSNAADLVVLRDGTSEIGKIKYSANDNLAVYASAANHAGINFIENAIIPMSAGAETNNAISLGDATRGFKDLHLSGDITVAGDINVAGSLNTTSTTNLTVEDITITLNKSDSDSSGAANGAGIVIQDAVDASTDASILWNATNDEFDFSNGITVNGDISLPDHVPAVTGENAAPEDSAKIKVGTSDDLQIWHESTTGNSYISESGSGNLYISGNNLRLTNYGITESYLQADANGAVTLYYDGDSKINTTSSGVLVSGDVAVGHGAGTQGQVLEDGTTDVSTLRFDSQSWRIWTGHDPDGAGSGAAIDSELLRLTSGGNLGVGTFSNAAEPTHHLHLMSTTANTNTAEDIIKIESKSSGTTAVGFGANILFNAERADGTQQDQGRIGFIASGNVGTSGSEVLSSDFVIGTATGGTISNKVFVKAGGNVGIGPFVSGTTDPARKLHVLGSGTTIATLIEASDANQASVDLKNTQSWFRLIASNGEFYVYDQADTAERFRIDTSGNVGIGGVDPATKLHVDGTTTITGALTLGDIVFPTAKGSANQILAMNAGATALEFVTPYGDSSVDTHLNQSTADANEVLIWGGSDYSWGAPPAINNIALNNTNVTITDNNSDAGYITATVDGSAIVTINASGITADNITASTKFIGDVKGASFFTAEAGENLAKGQLVHITGYDNTDDLATVEKASASAGGEYGVGLVMADATSGDAVDILTEGILSGFDTTAFNAGDTVYMGSTAGQLVTVPPAGNSNNIQRVGRILKDHASLGSIYFYGSGQIADVKNLDAKKIFVGSTSNYATQGDNTLEVDMANSEVTVVGDVKLTEGGGYYAQETLKRDSNNVPYSSGDASGFEHKDSIKLVSYNNESVLDLFQTPADGSGGYERRQSIRLRSGGSSWIYNKLNLGSVTPDSAQLNITPPDTPGSDEHVRFLSNNPNTGANNGVIGIIRSQENATTNTTSSLEIVLSSLVGSTITDKILLSADPSTTSSIDGDLDIVSALTAFEIASDSTLSTGSYTLPNATGNAGQVLAYPSSGTTLEWVNKTPDIDDVPDAARTLARIMGWVPGYNNNVENSIIWNTTEDAAQWTPATSGSSGIVHKAFYVRAGQTINATVTIKGSVEITRNGLDLVFYQHYGSDLPDGKTHVSNQATYSTVQSNDATVYLEEDHDLLTTYDNVVSTGDIVFNNSGWVSLAIVVSDGLFTGSDNPIIYVKDPIIDVTGATKLDMITMQYVLG